MNGTWLARFAGAAGLILILKATLVLSLGVVIAALLRRRSAAARHLVWLTALSGVLALTAFAPVAPRLPVDLPRAAALAATPLASLSGLSAAPDSPLGGASVARALGGQRALEPAPHRRRLPLWPWAGALWLAGTVAVLLWSAVGHVGLRALDRAASSVERGDWTRRYGASPPGEGAASRARLGLSSEIGTPLTWGWARPVVLLPRTSAAWPIERRRAALLHELGHVARGDYLAQTVGTLACAVYWFHPLVWWCAGRLRSESEHACDDLVLAAGTPAPEYASNLLEVARAARAGRGSAIVAIGMARRSNLEGRLLAILDDARARGVSPTRAGMAKLGLTLLILLPVAGLEPRFDAADAHEASKGRAISRAETPASDADKPGSSLEDDVPASPGGLLDLDLETGGSVEIRGWERNQVNVRSQLGGTDWADSRVEIAPAGNGVRVRCFQQGRSRSTTTSHHFKISVPSSYDVRLRSSGGDVAIVGVEGTFRGSTGGGQLVLERDRGHASLSTGGGDIEVSDSDLSGAVMTGGGTVRISRVRGGLRGSSGSGPVLYSDGEASSQDDPETGDLTNVQLGGEHERIQVEDQTVGFLHIHKAGGAVDLEDAPHGADIETGGGEIQVRHGSGSILAHTGGGDIAVGPIAGSVSAGTGAGDVHVILASTAGREQSVDIWSGTGKVIVELPDDLNARFEVETAYTESFRRPTRITSDWPLERDAVTGWDDSEGTARRHVRARGVAGDGGGVIHIKTVNGDIELRRVAARSR